MAAVQLQPSSGKLAPESVFSMNGHPGDTLAQLRAASNRDGDLNFLEGKARQIEANLDWIERGIRELEGFVDIVGQPSTLTQGQLEMLAGLMDEKSLPVERAVASSDEMAALADLLENAAGLLEKPDRPEDHNLQRRAKDYAARWRAGRQRVLQLAQQWKNGMYSLRLLAELAKRRPLTTREKILMLHASIIDTPVVRDPSDNREDWYEYDG